MPRLVRSAVLNDYVEVAQSVGLDPYRMIAAHGLPSGCLSDPELRIPMTAVAQLLEDSAARSARPDFALKLAERRSLSNVGALALLVREQPTMRKALEALADYMHLHSVGLRLTIEEDGEGMAIIALAVDSGRPVPIRQGVELALGFIHRSLQQLLGRSWRPQAVCFIHSPPARKDAHRRFFGTNIEFGQDYNAIVCLAADIDAPVPTSDPAMADHARRYLESLAPRANATMRHNARECIQGLLPSGLCSADRVAKHLGVDRRTLHRHLAQDGETFLTGGWPQTPLFGATAFGMGRWIAPAWLPPQALDLAHPILSSAVLAAVRRRAAVTQTRRALGAITRRPAIALPHRDPRGLRRLHDAPARFCHAFNQQESTCGVNRAFLWMFIRGSSLGCRWWATNSFSGQPRMNNLHSIHS